MEAFSRSPRWFSGYPRMLLLIELVLQLESHVGPNFEFICKVNRDRQLRAPRSVGRHNLMRVDEGRRGSSLVAMEIKGTYLSGERRLELA